MQLTVPDEFVRYVERELGRAEFSSIRRHYAPDLDTFFLELLYDGFQAFMEGTIEEEEGP